MSLRDFFESSSHNRDSRKKKLIVKVILLCEKIRGHRAYRLSRA